MTEINKEHSLRSPKSEEETQSKPKMHLRLASSEVNKIGDRDSADNATLTSKVNTKNVITDSSITVYEDEKASPHLSLIICDAIATAFAIAFMILIFQDNIPFIK